MMEFLGGTLSEISEIWTYVSTTYNTATCTAIIMPYIVGMLCIAGLLGTTVWAIIKQGPSFLTKVHDKALLGATERIMDAAKAIQASDEAGIEKSTRGVKKTKKANKKTYKKEKAPDKIRRRREQLSDINTKSEADKDRLVELLDSWLQEDAEQKKEPIHIGSIKDPEVTDTTEEMLELREEPVKKETVVERPAYSVRSESKDDRVARLFNRYHNTTK